jgi:hypothetical protein
MGRLAGQKRSFCDGVNRRLSELPVDDFELWIAERPPDHHLRSMTVGWQMPGH